MTKKTRALNPRGRGVEVLSYNSDGGARRKISGTPEGYQNLVLWACPNSFPPLTGNNSTTTNYIRGTNTFFRSITLGDNLTSGP